MRKRKYTALLQESSAIQQDADTPETLVHNMVGTTQIESSIMPINLLDTSRKLPNSYYNRRKFAAITIRIGEPKCTALLFTSGKLVLTGSKGWNQCVLASLEVVRMLKRINVGIDFWVIDTTIQNIVGNVEIGLKPNEILDLKRFYKMGDERVTYQPNMFPGLIYRPDDSPVVILCFFSGKIVITGGKCMRDIVDGWKMLWPTVKQHRRIVGPEKVQDVAQMSPKTTDEAMEAVPDDWDVPGTPSSHSSFEFLCQEDLNEFRLEELDIPPCETPKSVPSDPGLLEET